MLGELAVEKVLRVMQEGLLRKVAINDAGINEIVFRTCLAVTAIGLNVKVVVLKV
jgi:hypothetical protein